MKPAEREFIDELQHLVDVDNECDYAAAGNFSIPKNAGSFLFHQRVRRVKQGDFDGFYAAKIATVTADYAEIYKTFRFTEARPERYQDCAMFWFPIGRQDYFLHFMRFGHPDDDEFRTFQAAVRN